VDGQLSLYFYQDDEVRPGLSVLPEAHRMCYSAVPDDGLYACNRCGLTRMMKAGSALKCPECEREIWSRALSTQRT
jgi:DNA-directed RNA polymerase subunit RPC12/RpoP